MEMNKVKHICLWSMFVILICCYGPEGKPVRSAITETEKPDVVIDTVRIGMRSVQFYVDFGADSATLGFSIENDLGQRRYFPMYGSTYRGIPSVTLNVWVPEFEDEMWVQSSWSGYETLAYYRMGTDRCITQYGEISSFPKPMPESLNGGVMRFPDKNISKVSNVATIEYDGK